MYENVHLFLQIGWGSADLRWAWLLSEDWIQVYSRSVRVRVQAEGAATSRGSSRAMNGVQEAIPVVQGLFDPQLSHIG